MKIRSELAAVEVAAGKFAAADALARVEAESLLGDDRKDRLAEVYRGFANRLLNPDLPTARPDVEGAYAMLTQARSLAKGQALRATILVEMARASRKGGVWPRAINDYQAYLKEYPKGADRVAVRYELGESQLRANQPLPARLTWSDLARDLEKVDTAEAADLRAKSLYGIAKTHGIPTPPDDAQMNLGVAALKKMLAVVPVASAGSVRASYEIAESYLARGRSQEALAAFAAFINGDAAKANGEEAQRDPRRAARCRPSSASDRSCRARARYDEAIAAYKAYLAKYPNGPQSADAQRAVLDAEIQIAEDLIRKRKIRRRPRRLAGLRGAEPAGRAASRRSSCKWATPSSARRSTTTRSRRGTTLAGKFPNTEPAGHAQFAIASTYEIEKGDPATAIDRFRKVTVAALASPGQPTDRRDGSQGAHGHHRACLPLGRDAQAQDRDAEHREADLHRLQDRPRDLLPQEAHAAGVEQLDIGLVAPDAEWTADVPAYAKFKPIDTEYELEEGARCPACSS